MRLIAAEHLQFLHSVETCCRVVGQGELERSRLILNSGHNCGQGELDEKCTVLGFQMKRREVVKCTTEAGLQGEKAVLGS